MNKKRMVFLFSGLARENLGKLTKRDDTTATDALIGAIEGVYLQEMDGPALPKGKHYRSYWLTNLTRLQLEHLQSLWQTSITETLSLILDRAARNPPESTEST